MTISNTSRTAGPFVGNGVTRDFPFSFKVFSRTDLLVAQTVTATGVETIKTLDGDYSVTLNSNQNANPGGVIRMVVAPPDGTTLAMTSNIDYSQTLDLTNFGGFNPNTISDALDRIVIQVQQLKARVGLGLNVGAAAAVATVLGFIDLLVTAAGATKIGFQQSAIGAILRTIFDKFSDSLNVMDFGPVGDGTADDTAALQKFINALGAKSSGNGYCRGGKRFKLTATLDFSVLNAAHRNYEIDFGGAEFVWGGSPLSTAAMLKLFNNKSVSIKNFTVLGSAAGPKTSVVGIFLDSLQPDGIDLVKLTAFRIAYCGTGILLGSTGAGQNRVSDSQIDDFVIESCGVGIATNSTNVDSIVFGTGIISACTKGFALYRCGFIEINTTTGYSCDAFITVEGPIDHLTVINSQSERGDLATPSFIYRKIYTLARQGTITLISCNVDDKIWLDYDSALGSDVQTLNIFGGYFNDLSVDAPDSIVNLNGTTQLGGVIAVSGANSKVYPIGSKFYGARLDYANAFRYPVYGDVNNNYSIGTTPGQYAATGRSVLYMDGAGGALYGLGYNGARAGYLASGVGLIELAADGARQINLTSNGNIVARVRSNGAFKFIPQNFVPATPEKGDTYFDDGLGKLRCWDGSAWQNLY